MPGREADDGVTRRASRTVAAGEGGEVRGVALPADRSWLLGRTGRSEDEG